MPERTDRELLELAAKAAGLGEVWYLERSDTPYIGKKFQIGMPIEYKAWNPLTNDGDTLRLAASLGFQYEIDREPGSGTLTRPSRPIRVRVWASGWHKVDVGADIDPDLITAIRSAIVRAAAEIGANMKS